MTLTDKTVDQTDADLRALAVQVDAGEPLQIKETAGDQRTDAETDDQGTTDTQNQTSAAQASGEDGGEDSAPKDKPAAKPDPTKQQQQQEKKPAKESDYKQFLREREQLRKDQARLAANFRKLQEEAQRVRQAPAAKPDAQAQTQQPQVPPPNPALAKFGTDELHEVAAQYEADGDTRIAGKVRAEIARRAQAPSQQQQPAQQQQQPARPAAMPQEQFVAEWQGHLQQLTAQDPALNDPQSPVFNEMKEVIKHPYFSEHPARVREAYELTKLRLEARAAPELRTRIKTLETELKKLRKATAPGGGDAENRGTPKSFDQMSESEQIAWMKAEAARADAA